MRNLLAYSFLFACLQVFAFAKDARPNIIVMMVDDMGFAGPSVAPYGNPNYKTPGMDRLAAEGMLFTDFHSSGTVCSPTRAGLLTGRYQQRAGIEAVIHPAGEHPEHRKGLQKSEVTFAELFKHAGYATGVVGKWHLGYPEENADYHPQNHGFDYFKGYHSGNIDYINHWGDHMEHDWWHGRKETVEEGYTTHLINRYALEFIEENQDKPFCLYIAHESPHSPIQGPDDPIQRGPGAEKRLTPKDEAMKQMILEMDKGVEQVRAKLVKLGLEKNTLFLFFSDNGDAPSTATGHPSHRGNKGSVYEGGTRVPLIAWWPGKIESGASAEALSISLDVMPTILSVAEIEAPPTRPLDGIDLSPVLFGQGNLPDRPLFWAALSNNGPRSEAMRKGNWKLVVQHPKAKLGTFENEQVELYRLDEDLEEETDLAAEEPKRAAAMLKQVKDWYADTERTRTPQPGGWLSPVGEKWQARQAKWQARQATLRKKVSGSRPKADGCPNILFICTDDQAPWALGASGNKQAVTPHMDRLVSEGAYLVNSFVSTPVCSPSRAATLTGRYGYEAGVRNWVQFGKGAKGQGIEPESVTSAELLKQSGYSTSLIGKWHLGEETKHHPNNHGFDYFMGHIQGGFAVNDPTFQRNGKPIQFEGLTADILADDVISRLDSHTSGKQENPFFIAWHTRAPHTKWLPVAPEDMAPYDVEDFRADVPDYPDLNRKEVDRRMKEYLASTRSVDRNLGRVMEALDERGLAENTIVIYTSDHGYHMGHHGIWHKGNGKWILNHPVPRDGNIGENQRPNMWENSIRVPSFVRWPGKIKPGIRIDADTTNLDWFPTILSMAGVDQPEKLGVRGENLVPLLTGKAKDTKREGVFSFLSFYEDYERVFIAELRMWRTDRWKLVRDFRNPHLDELYDLKNDPGETRNEINNPEHKMVVAELDAKILTEMRKSDDPALQYLSTRKEADFFNGKNLSGWKGNEGFWSVKEGAIVGHSEEPVAKNEFLWSDVPVGNFHFSVDVKLTPNGRNAGIQFRSKPINDHGQAHGYQADVGGGVWGKLYHEHGRGKLDWNNRAKGAVKPGEWNRYEILAVGDRVWTAINGILCVAVKDPEGERSGQIALQIHSGSPQTVHYRNPALTHNPPVELAGKNEKELDAKLRVPEEPVAKPAGGKSAVMPRIKPRVAATAAKEKPKGWPEKIAKADPGSQGEAWAKPDFDDSAWKTMKLPGHFEKAGLPDFDGVVWFRKTVTLTADQASAKATLHLGQIDDMDVTWVNGRRVGGYETPGHHYTVRVYPVPSGVLRKGKNTIAVRVIDHGFWGGIAGSPDLLSLRLGAEEISLATSWRFAPGANRAALTGSAVVTARSKPAPDPETAPTDGFEHPLPAVAPRFSDGFVLEEDDVVAFLGGTVMVKQMESGDLESFLTHAAGDRPVLFRDLSWQADTVYLRQRPRNFGTQTEALSRIGATVAVAAFGQMEAMVGKGRLPEFIEAYEVLLEEVRLRTEKIVLVTPYPFTVVEGKPHYPDLTGHNEAVVAYGAAIRELANRRGWICVDLGGFDTGGLTVDGIQLTPDGYEKWARVVTRQLMGEPVAVLPERWEVVREQIGRKNVLWRRFWRPTNWAFLYGNRQTQPSSLDHRPGYPRWFPEEINAIVPLIEEAEDQIINLQSKSK